MEFSREKLMILFGVSMIIAGGLLLFLLLNNAWGFITQANNFAARTRSELMYNLLYKWPDESSYASAHRASTVKTAASIPVLLYHGEGDASNMPTAVFLEQMRSIKEAGWQTITLEQFDEYMKSGAPVPDKSFLLTFDDGRKDTFYQADPILKDLGFNAVMFVITDFSLPIEGKPSMFYLSESELNYMQKSGRWNLQSHGDQDHKEYSVQSTTDLAREASAVRGHFLSNKFWLTGENRFENDEEFAARVAHDLAYSKTVLENTFGRPIIAYAYPFNDFGEDTVNFPDAQKILDAMMPSIYTYAFYQTWTGNGDTFNYPQTNNGPGSVPYMIKRIEPDATWSGTYTVHVLEEGSAKGLPYGASSFTSEWAGSWGTVTAGTKLMLSATPKTSGAAAYLNGSGVWRNYIFSATVHWERGSSISLLARYTDNQNYRACTFSRTIVSIEDHTGAVQTVRAQQRIALNDSREELHIAIKVQGQRLTCYINGEAHLSALVQSAPMGGIGVEIWDENLGYAQSEVMNVSVEEI